MPVVIQVDSQFVCPKLTTLSVQHRQEESPRVEAMWILPPLRADCSQWSDGFDGMTITYREGMTTIAGDVIDQAALHGILIRIRDRTAVNLCKSC